MVKTIHASETLKRMCYDIEKMIDNNTEPKVVLKMISRKIKYLENDKSYIKVLWWNDDNDYRPQINKISKIKDFDDYEEDLLIDGVTIY